MEPQVDVVGLAGCTAEEQATLNFAAHLTVMQHDASQRSSILLFVTLDLPNQPRHR